MNYQRPQLLEELAAQYVLGTLRGPARRRFERYCAHNANALHAVRRWEDRLVDLLAGVVPVAPSTLVWDRIKFRVRRDKRAAAEDAYSRRSVTGVSRRPRASRRSRSRSACGPASARAARSRSQGSWSEQQGQLWSIEAPRNRGELRVAATDNLALDPARAYELWALPGDGAAPVSLGLMPKSGRGTLELSDAQRVALSRSRQVAISLEPPGGSPTGAPTGPVLFVADIAVAG